MAVRSLTMSRVNVAIEEMRSTDWEAVREIYLQGIATGNATFETDAPDYPTWNRNHLNFAQAGRSNRRRSR